MTGRERISRMALDKLGIPRAFHMSVFSEVIGNSSAKDTVKKYVNQFKSLPAGTGLFIHGPPLSGKSMLAAIVAKSFLARLEPSYTLLWTNLNKMTSVLFDRSTGSAEPQELPTSFDEFSDVDVLVVDGLSSMEISDAKTGYIMNDGMRTSFCQVIHARTLSEKTTIITSRFPLSSSNIEKQTVKTLFGDAVYHLLKNRYVIAVCVENPSVHYQHRRKIDKILGKGDDE